MEDLLGVALSAALVRLARRRADERHVHLLLDVDLGFALVVENGLSLLVVNVAADDLARGVVRECRRRLGAGLLAVQEHRRRNLRGVDVAQHVHLHQVVPQPGSRLSRHDLNLDDVLGLDGLGLFLLGSGCREAD